MTHPSSLMTCEIESEIKAHESTTVDVWTITDISATITLRLDTFKTDLTKTLHANLLEKLFTRFSDASQQFDDVWMRLKRLHYFKF